MSFTKTTINSSLRVDLIEQDAPDAKVAWRTLILFKSKGFTSPRVERLNDSIRTYVWAILGAQSQTRTGILGSGTAFDAQKQFLVEVEGTVSSPADLSSAISRYQDILKYAGSEVNFVFGTCLYMALSDMLFRVDRAAGYNNIIVIATDDQTLGLNSGLDVADMPVAPPNASGDTEKIDLVKPPSGSPLPRNNQRPSASHLVQPTASNAADSMNHEDEKTALIVGAIAVGLAML